MEKIKETIFYRVFSILLCLTLLMSQQAFATEGVSVGNVTAGEANHHWEGNTLVYDALTPDFTLEYTGDGLYIESGWELVFNMLSESGIANLSDISGNISYLNGGLTSNGIVTIFNTAGIHFGLNFNGNVASLLASTHAMSNNGNNFYTLVNDPNGKGLILFEGNLVVKNGGLVAFLSQAVNNKGIIKAELSEVIFGASEKATVDLDTNGTFSVVLEGEVKEAVKDENGDVIEDAVLNSGEIHADGGKVLLTAKVLEGIFEKAVNNTGLIKADSLAQSNGEVYLLAAGENALAANSGTIIAGAKGPGVNGGFVEISGPRVSIEGIIDLAATDGVNGRLLIDPTDTYVATIDPNIATPGIGSWISEATLESLVGSFDLVTNGNPTDSVFFDLVDNFLNLAGFGAGDAFRVIADLDINLGDTTIQTGGGNVILQAGNNINNGTGKIIAPLLLMIAKNNIGSATNAINTDVDYLGAYSWGTGDIHIKEDNNIELGFTNLAWSTSLGQFVEMGTSVAANEGVIRINADGDIIVNQVISERGGVFLGSDNGSIHAGQGWMTDVSGKYLGSVDSSVWADYATFLGLTTSFNSSDFVQEMNTVGTTGGWASLDIQYFSPVVVGTPALKKGPHVVAGSYSEFSAVNGTIGAAAPGQSGGIKGIVRRGGSGAPSPIMDLGRVTPTGTVLYMDTVEDNYQAFPLTYKNPSYWTTTPQQHHVWPAAPAASLSSPNPLEVNIQVLSQNRAIPTFIPNGTNSAVRSGFTIVPSVALALEIGNSIPVVTPEPAIPNLNGLIADELRFKIPKKHIADSYQVSHSQGPIQLFNNMQVLFYSPIVETEMYGVDPVLGVEAYGFIDGNLSAPNLALLPGVVE